MFNLSIWIFLAHTQKYFFNWVFITLFYFFFRNISCSLKNFRLIFYYIVLHIYYICHHYFQFFLLTTFSVPVYPISASIFYSINLDLFSSQWEFRYFYCTYSFPSVLLYFTHLSLIQFVVFGFDPDFCFLFFRFFVSSCLSALISWKVYLLAACFRNPQL